MAFWVKDSPRVSGFGPPSEEREKWAELEGYAREARTEE